MAKVGFWLRGTRGKLAGASMGKGLNGQTIIREIVTPRNPNTIAQISQRMKVSPAHRFYNAFSDMLSNAFESVMYGGDSRRYFMGLAMKMTGPFIQRGVTRFVPAIYPFSRGSLNTVGIEPFNGGATVITLSATTAEAAVTPAVLAEALGVGTDYQISVAVVNNKLGIFEPSYISFDDRLTIADLPQAALAKDANNHITISITGLGLDATAVVAMAVVLSTQDSSGKWLRSNQDVVISNELYAQLYSTDAYNAAVASYQAESPNAINSTWYYNLGLSQPFNGRLQLMTVDGWIEGESGEDNFVINNCIVGIQEENGRIVYSVFVDDETTPTGVYCYVDGSIQLVPYTYINQMVEVLRNRGFKIALWDSAYAAQVSGANGAMNRSASADNFTIATQAGVDVELVGARIIAGKIGEADSDVVVLYDTAGNEYLFRNGNMESPSYEKYMINPNGYANTSGYPKAWDAVTVPAATDANTISSEFSDVNFNNWLQRHGISMSVITVLP